MYFCGNNIHERREEDDFLIPIFNTDQQDFLWMDAQFSSHLKWNETHVECLCSKRITFIEHSNPVTEAEYI